MYAPGHGGEKWNEFYKKGIIAIGWGAIGDLSQFSDKNQMKAKMKSVYDPKRPYKNDAHATWQFAKEMKPGDIVFVKYSIKFFNSFLRAFDISAFNNRKTVDIRILLK